MKNRVTVTIAEQEYTLIADQDAAAVEKIAAHVDAKVREVIDAFHYRVAKEIGAMAAAMKGQVDQIILTGGIAHGQETVDALKGYVSWIAPVTVYPGEGELLALAEGALRVLRGKETAKIYE